MATHNVWLDSLLFDDGFSLQSATLLSGDSKYGGTPERLGMNLVTLNQTK